ncbi:hypothetical protein FGO68_gene7595 [Halteria grandinella]|uniref:Uncharacterized protein n=1 Tax=Halteria grandinella TaxID=5974 RepID=A0A8J8NM84_HALGN|nr:hypothetical protein FGO68_gene7595 [Halteria grandinella]
MTMSPEDQKIFDDFKVKLLKSELINMLGQEVFQRLETLFGDSYDEILIRRCQAHDKFINFHTDVSLKTLQLALNGDEDYEGGKLVYMNGEGMVVPKREAGSITIHDNQIVHGVTNFTKGTRYGLFLLKKRTSLIE